MAGRRAGSAGGSTVDPAEKIHRRTFVKAIRVGLNQGDREPFVTELTAKLSEHDELAKEMAEAAASYRAARKKVKERIDELALTLKEGQLEDHEVEEVKDFTLNTVTTFRTDTKQIVEKRELTDDDLQLELGGPLGAEEQGDPDDPAAA